MLVCVSRDMNFFHSLGGERPRSALLRSALLHVMRQTGSGRIKQWIGCMDMSRVVRDSSPRECAVSSEFPRPITCELLVLGKWPPYVSTHAPGGLSVALPLPLKRCGFPCISVFLLLSVSVYIFCLRLYLVCWTRRRLSLG